MKKIFSNLELSSMMFDVCKPAIYLGHSQPINAITERIGLMKFM
jgi:hypothetical protein